VSTDYAGRSTDSRAQLALGELIHYHQLAQSATRDRLAAVGAALAAGATPDQAQAAMDGLGITDALLRSL
jgi:hypothetical protein